MNTYCEIPESFQQTGLDIKFLQINENGREDEKLLNGDLWSELYIKRKGHCLSLFLVLPKYELHSTF